MHQRESEHRAGQERVGELDGVRAVAVLLVVIWHYLGAIGGPESTEWKLFIFGRTGVDLFFVLSGYLITGILLNNAGASNYFSTFYARRSFRIFPIYFGMVAIYLLGRQLGGSAPVLFGGTLPWWSYIVGVQNIWMTIEQSYGALWLAATWSLAIEEQFYLLFPLVVYFSSTRTLRRFLIALVVLCPIARVAAYLLGDHFGYYVLMPLRADILAIGALIALLQFSAAVTQPLRRVCRIVFWLTAGFFPLFAWVFDKSDFNMAVWGHTYLVAFYGSAVFTVLDNSGARSLALLRSRAAAFFARISYALYLVHGPALILTFLAVRASPTIHTASGVLLTICAFAISVAICWASYLFVEGPLIRMAHQRFRYVGPTARAHGFSAR